jgi:hypothetical protein
MSPPLLLLAVDLWYGIALECRGIQGQYMSIGIKYQYLNMRRWMKHELLHVSSGLRVYEQIDRCEYTNKIKGGGVYSTARDPTAK